MGSETAVLGGNVPAMVAESAEKAAGCAEATKADVVSGQGVAAMPASADAVLAEIFDAPFAADWRSRPTKGVRS
jgi:hypothetical protein